jgi:hypothetical protein
MSGSGRSRDGVRALTYLVVVVFGGVYDRDIAGFERLARGLKTIVQLLGDAKSSGSYHRRLTSGGQGGRRIACDHGVAGRTCPEDQDFVLVLGWRRFCACPSHAIDDCVALQDARNPPYWEHDHSRCFDKRKRRRPSALSAQSPSGHGNLFAPLSP